MKFLRKIKPSRVLGTKEHKPSIQGAVLRLEERPTLKAGGRPNDKEMRDHLVLYATNGVAFIRIDLGEKEPLDEPGPLPRVALQHLERGVHGDLGMDRVRVGITSYDRVISEDAPEPATALAAFPNFEAVQQEQWPSDPTGANRLTLELDPRLLLAVAEGIGAADGIQITLDLRHTREYPNRRRRWYAKALKLTPRDPSPVNPAEALVMPMRPIEVPLRDDFGREDD